MSKRWDEVKASELARKAYGYPIKTLPKDANIDVLAPHEDAALDAQRTGNWQAYENALRTMVRAGKREALRIERERAA
jgi:hypothetical protein